MDKRHSISLGTRRTFFAFCYWAVWLSNCHCRELTQTTVAPVPTSEIEGASNPAEERVVQLYVYGGSNAPKGRYPYLVSVQDEFGGHRCTAVLIHPFWVVSAAHCVIENLELHIGAYSLYDTFSDGVEIRKPKATFLHESWTGHPLDGYDIVLFQLETASTKLPVKLHDDSVPITVGDRLTIAGWGNNGVKAGTQEILQHATKINRVELKFCGLHDDWPVSDSDNGLCAIGKTQNTCQGDSGGPLLLPDPENRRNPKMDTLIGITSFGHSNCSETKFPTYFTSVSEFHSWIEEKISSGQKLTEQNSNSEKTDNFSLTTRNHGVMHFYSNSVVFAGLVSLVIIFLFV